MNRGPRSAVVAAMLVVGLSTAFAATALASAGIGFGAEEAAVRATFSSLRFTGLFGTEECAVTLSGTLAGATRKTAGWLAGAVQSAPVGTCSRGSLSLPAEALPWMLRYRSFQGTLPTISGVSLSVNEIAVVITEFGVRCLYRGTGTARLNAPEATQLSLEGTLPLVSGEFCSSSGALTGVGTLSPRLGIVLLAPEGGGISAANVGFPDTAVGSSSREPCAITNNTNFRADIASVNIRGDRVFTVSPSRDFAVRANTSSDVTVTFRPTERRAFSATLEFLDLEGNVLFTSTLTGTGT